MRKLTPILACCACLGPAGVASADASFHPQTPGLRSIYDNSTLPIIWNGHWVQRDPVVHLVFWGPKWRQDTTGIVAAEANLFRQLAGTSYNGLLRQYGVHNDVRLAGWFFDSHVPPTSRSVTANDIAYEADRARRLHRWHTGHNDQWIVLPQPGTNLKQFAGECGEHYPITVWNAPGAPRRDHTHRFYNLILVHPFQDAGYANCIDDYSTDDSQNAPSLVAATTSLTSHEYVEAATDPIPGAGWATGPMFPTEIADLCYFYSGVPAGMTVNVSYLWSNALHDRLNGCALGG